jgi:uncharacterized protein YukE
MSVNRLEKLKEQLQRVIDINDDVARVYKGLSSRKFQKVMQMYIKRARAFVTVVNAQVKLESVEDIQKYSDDEFDFIVSEISTQINDLEKDWENDKARMGVLV